MRDSRDKAKSARCNKCLMEQCPQVDRDETGNQKYLCIKCNSKKVKKLFNKDDFNGSKSLFPLELNCNRCMNKSSPYGSPLKKGQKDDFRSPLHQNNEKKRDSKA